MIIPKAQLRRAMKEAGAERVSNDAILALQKYLNNECRIISQNANTFAQNDGRKTVLARDVEAVFSLE